MSCIAGVGGDVPQLVKLAQVRAPGGGAGWLSAGVHGPRLARHGVLPTRHYQLQHYGVRKRLHEDFDGAAQLQVRVLEPGEATHGCTCMTAAPRCDASWSASPAPAISTGAPAAGAA